MDAKKSAQRTVLEAGGVVFRYVDARTLFLIVRSSDGTSWLFPKGHIEAGETADVAAAREVREETGVDAIVRAPLGKEQFRYGKATVNVDYFLMEFLGLAVRKEDRETRWCTYSDAYALLSFEETKRVIDRAITSLRQD